MTAQADVKDLKKRASVPVNKAGGNTVQQFFEANRGTIEAVLPKHMTADRLMKIAMQAIRTTPQLKECTAKSLFGAVIQCAEMGLEPQSVLGHAYLVPFKNRKAGTTDVQVIIGWKGLVDLARRSGHITSIQAHAVRAQDKFDYAYGLNERLEHVPAGDNSEITHFYAYAKFVDGGHAFEVLPRSKVDEIRNSSQGYQNALRSKKDHPWISHYEEMGRKTAIRRLAKYLPLSVELATATALDNQAESGADQGLGSVLDGEYQVTSTEETSEAGSEQGPSAPPEEPTEQSEEANGSGPTVTLDDVTAALRSAQDADALAEQLDRGRDLPAEAFEQAKAVYQERLAQLQDGQSGEPSGESTEEPPRGDESQGGFPELE